MSAEQSNDDSMEIPVSWVGTDDLPLLMRADQVYYRTSRWQKDEAESWADLRNGDFVEYDSPLDAVRAMHQVD